MHDDSCIRMIALCLLCMTLPGCSDTSSQEIRQPQEDRVGPPRRSMPRPIKMAHVGLSETSHQISLPLGPGNSAPSLKVTKFVHGDAVDNFEPGQIYAIQFWATFCGTCRQTMPQFAKLQERYADDVTMIGVTTEDEETVLEFLSQNAKEGKTWSDLLTYRIALDDDRQTLAAFRESDDENSLPFVAIIGRTGLVEWMGHPALITGPLKSIVEGDWDYELAREAMLSDIKGQESIDRHQHAIVTAVNAGNYQEAVSFTDRMMKSLPNNRKILALKKQLLLDGKLYQHLDDVLEKLVEVNHNDPLSLNGLAWEIAAEMDIPNRNLDIALRAAKRASELTHDQDSSILETVARIYFERGNLVEAVRWQEKAVDAQPKTHHLTQVLQEYRSELAETASNSKVEN